MESRGLEMCIRDRSASWGMFQIMGYHWQALGYKSVVDFVMIMSESEGKQLEIFVKFIQANKTLLNAIRAKDFDLFALTYNGPDYRKNNYHVKMARANNKYAYMNKVRNAWN